MTWETLLPTHDIPLWWHGCGIMLVTALALFNWRIRSSNIIVVCISRLPGVFLHELAHFLVGFALRAEPDSFKLIPERRYDGSWTLGSVAFRRVTPFNAVPIAFAPLGLIPVAIYLSCSWFNWRPLALPDTLFLYWAVFLLTSNALPSRQDVKVACNWKSLLLYGSVSGIIWYVGSSLFRL